jgi:hypothetical protein
LCWTFVGKSFHVELGREDRMEILNLKRVWCMQAMTEKCGKVFSKDGGGTSCTIFKKRNSSKNNPSSSSMCKNLSKMKGFLGERDLM